MISVQQLWLSQKDFTRKDHAGYTSTDEFNRMLNQAQSELFEYYLMKIQQNTRQVAALQPFVVEQYLSGTQYYNLPEDYRYKLEVGFELVENGPDCTPVSELRSANHYTSDKDLLSIESPIRGPSVTRKIFGYEFIANQIKTYPVDFNGRVYLKYYREPVTVARGYTLNTTTQEEEYDAGSTVDLEWPASEEYIFRDILLMYKGIILRESEIVQWIVNKRGTMPESVHNTQ